MGSVLEILEFSVKTTLPSLPVLFVMVGESTSNIVTTASAIGSRV